MHRKNLRAALLRQSVVACMVMAATWGAAAQGTALEPLRNVVQLSASGSVEVQQDWLQMTLAAAREGADAAAVQRQLQQAVDAAMRHLRGQVQEPAMQVRSGSFGVYPRHGNDGKIKGWQGRAELVLEGKDFARITQAAAQVEGMAVAHIEFGLSKEGQAKVEEQAQSLAVENFKNRAALLARQFGFSSYSLREVNVSSQDSYPMPRMPRPGMLAASAKMEMADAVPVEAGKAQVLVNIAGSVQLQ